MTKIVIVAGLTVMWVALWQDASAGTVLAGVLVSTGLTLTVPGLRDARWSSAPRPVETVRFLVAFGRNLARATAQVAWEVMTPTSYVREGIVAVRLDTSSQWIVTLVANAISVTPGTVTVDVDPPSTLYIHVMHLEDLDASRLEVKRLEELAIRAFGTQADLARLVERGRTP